MISLVMLAVPDTTEAYALVDSAGVAHDLNAETGYAVLVGQEGRWVPPIALAEDEVPIEGGARLRAVRDKARTLSVPLLILGDTRAEKVGRLRALQRWLRTPRGAPATYRCTAVDGAVREIEVYYAGGLEGHEGDSGWGERHANVEVALRVPYPYWRDTADTTLTFALPLVSPPTFFKSPWYPVRFTAASLLADVVVENDGDAVAWPRWEITGPSTGTITLRNLHTGEVTTVARALGPGQQVVIDTRPDVAAVSDGLGTNLYPALGGTALWGLAPGMNRVQVELGNATAASKIVLAYRREWLSP